MSADWDKCGNEARLDWIGQKNVPVFLRERVQGFALVRRKASRKEPDLDCLKQT